jgi:hypothetical protein
MEVPIFIEEFRALEIEGWFWVEDHEGVRWSLLLAYVP